MSPRFRWSVGWARPEPDQAAALGPGPGPRPAGPPASRLAGELGTLAAAGRTGALHVVGRPGGMVYLAAGHVVQVESWTTPGVEALLLPRALDRDRWREVLTGMSTSHGRDVAVAMARDVLQRGLLPPVEVDLAGQRSAVDAACALLGNDGAEVVRTRFLRDEQPWLALSAPLPLDLLVDRVARHADRLARVAHRVRPDTPVATRPDLPSPAVRLTGFQWDLVTHADGTTPRDLAWLLGRGVAVTTLEVSRLEGLGLLQAVPHDG